MGRSQRYLCILASLTVMISTSGLRAADAPHDESFGIVCESCHTSPITPQADPGTFTGATSLCLGCHIAGGVAGDLPLRRGAQAVVGAAGTSHRWDSNALAYVRVDDPKGGTGRIGVGGLYDDPTTPALFLFQITAGGELGVATISWTDTFGGSGNATVDSTVDIGHGLHLVFFDGSLPVSFPLGMTFHVTAAPIGIPAHPAMASELVEGRATCTTCHDQHANTLPPFLRVSKQESALCEACHADRVKGRWADAPAANIGQHPVHVLLPSNELFTTSTLPVALDNHGTPGNAADDTVECLSCHSVHEGDTNTDGDLATLGTGDGRLLVLDPASALCQACHDYQDHQGRQCLDCHTAHETDNILLVREMVNGQPLTFDSRNPGAFIHKGPGYDGVCETCHTTTDYHQGSAAGDHSHFDNQRCSACHVHRNGLVIRPNDCLSCHRSELNVTPDGQPTRSVTDDFSREFGHHPLTYHTKSDLSTPQDNNCLICHLEHSYYDANHGDETVNLDLDPDGSGQQEWQTYSLGNWCLDCHDGDNPDPNRRLGGQVAPDKSYLGTQSTHTEAHSIFKDGDTCGSCHQNGHTSRSQFFSYFFGDGAEENNCYGCHGGSANVSTVEGYRYMENMKVAFLGTGAVAPRSRHMTSPNNDGETICRRCHDPHRLDHYSNMLCDPDNPDQSWGTDANDAFCLRCHDGTQAAAPSHLGLDLAGRACAQCHLAHASTNLDLLLIQELATTPTTVAINPDPAVLQVGDNQSFDPILTPAIDYMPLSVRQHQAEWSVENLTGGSAGTEYRTDVNVPLDGSVGVMTPGPYGGVFGDYTLTVNSDTIITTGPMRVEDVNVKVDVKHSYRGDLEFTLKNLSTGETAKILQSNWSDGAFDLIVTLDSESPNAPHTAAATWDTLPDSLTAFNDRNSNGQWQIVLDDTWAGDNPTDPESPYYCFWRSWSLVFNAGVLGVMSDAGSFQALYEGTGRVHARFHHGKIWPWQSGLTDFVYEDPLPISSAVNLTITASGAGALQAAGTTAIAAPVPATSVAHAPSAPVAVASPADASELLKPGIREYVAQNGAKAHSSEMLAKFGCAGCHIQDSPSPK